jgi:hypothetical protein
MAFMNQSGSAPAIADQAPEESPDDIFLWPDDAQCLRSEWENGEMTHRSDDFMVVSVDSDEYESVLAGEVSYDDLTSAFHNLNARKTQSAAREPWELTDEEIDGIGRAEPAGQAQDQASAQRGAARGAGASESTRETVRSRTVSRQAAGLER